MKELKYQNIEDNLKKSNKIIIISIPFLVLTILFIYFGLEKDKQELPTPVEMRTLIREQSNEEKKYAYIDVNMKPYLFAFYENKGIEEAKKFYLVMDSNKNLYIVYMGLKNYQNLNVDNIKDNPIRITGITKRIDGNLKKMAIDSYNEELDEQYLSNENFEEYIGALYLDLEDTYHYSLSYYLCALFSGLIFLMLIIIYLSNIIKAKKNFKKIPQEKLKKIEIELQELHNNKYDELELYFLKEYLVSLQNNIVILNYQDIIFAYPYEKRYNGLLVNKNIKVLDKNNKIYDIANTKPLDKNEDEIIQNILSDLSQKNDKIIVGYNKENKKLAKEMLKKNK